MGSALTLKLKSLGYVLVISLAMIGCETTSSSASVYGRGACSGHGGVNCSAGADSDGSVICMDGWKNSSVQYTSVKKCN